MKTLPENYKKNVEILHENLRRGMSSKQAHQIINNFEMQFINANQYGEAEKHFIREMRGVMIENDTAIQVINN